MLFNLYKTDGTLPLEITDWEHLRVMRLDLTERQLYNHRFVEDTEEITQFRFEHTRDNNAPLKRVGFIGRDFHENRPSGQLSEEFFRYLSHYHSNEKHFEVFLLFKKKSS